MKRSLSFFANLLHSKNGNFALAAALMAPVLIGVAGMAVDYGNAYKDKSSLQNALDAAVLAAMAKSYDAEKQIAIAEEFFFGNSVLQSGIIRDVSFVHNDPKTITGVVTASTETSLLKVINRNSIDYSVTATAIQGPQTGHPVCIMAMHPIRKHTLELHDSVSINGPDCHIYGNSSHYDDVVDPHSPENFVYSASIQAVGYGHHYIQNLHPPLQRVVEVIKDPFLSKSIPRAVSCDFKNFKISGQTVVIASQGPGYKEASHKPEIGADSITLKPGNYCAGMNITKGAKIKLNPGLYILAGGEFAVEDSEMTGDGVTIVFSDRHVEMDISNSVLRLAAPENGTYGSFVMMGVRENTSHTFDNSTLDMYGIVYLPNGDIDWTSTGTPDITAEWTSWIADGFSWKGDGTINFPYNTSGSRIPHIPALNVIPRPNIVDVVRLAN